MALLLHQFIFFNILLPAHTRGAITLDGKHTVEAPGCCCCMGGTSKSDDGNSKHSPSKRDQENCAICNFAARVLQATPVDLTLPKLGLLEILPPARPASSCSISCASVYQSRGPPSL